MKKHVKIYLDYFGYSISDFIPCENCNSKAVDVHHITFKSQLGKDEIGNLIALCRKCHTEAHADRHFNEKLNEIHIYNLECRSAQ